MNIHITSPKFSKKSLLPLALSLVVLSTTLLLVAIPVQAATKPTSIKSLTAKNITENKAELQWKKKSAAKYYKVQLKSESNTVIKKWKRITKRRKTIKKKTGFLEAGTTYGYQVKACNNKGCGPWSSKHLFTTEDDDQIDYDADVAADILALEEEVFTAINDYRATKGLAALERNAGIAAIAREHSINMANGTVEFGHDGFNDRFVAMLLLGTGFGSGAENVAFSTDRSDLVDTITNGWIASEGHRINIENNYTESGMGISYNSSNNRYYFTQLFLVSS